jgi:hypothetical protein
MFGRKLNPGYPNLPLRERELLAYAFGDGAENRHGNANGRGVRVTVIGDVETDEALTMIERLIAVKRDELAARRTAENTASPAERGEHLKLTDEGHAT